MFKRAFILLAGLLFLNLPSWAQSLDLLKLTSRLKPTISFTQTYAETAVPDGAGGYVAIGNGPIKGQIIASLYGVDLSLIGGDSSVGISIGNFEDFHALSEDSTWKPGKTSATFYLYGSDADDNPVLAGSVTYAWNSALLSVTFSSTRMDAGTILTPINYDDGTIDDDTLEASVTFGDNMGRHSLVVAGLKKTTTKAYGSGDSAGTVDLISFSAIGAGDYHGPTLAVVSPKPPKGAAYVTTAGDTVVVTVLSGGTAVNMAVNGDEPVLADQDPNTSTRWTYSAVLQPGLNHIEITADDDGTGHSVAGVNIFYRKPTTLNLHTEGPVALAGVIRPYPAVSTQLVGTTIALSAIPYPGYIFTGWTGSVDSTSAALSFTVTDGADLTAHFIKSPFIPVAGVYDTSFQDPNRGDGAPTLSGGLRISVTATGVFTGSLILHGRTYVVRGQFAPDGTVSVPVQTDAYHEPVILSLTLDYENAAQGVLTGTIGLEEGEPLSFSSSRAYYSSRKLFTAVTPGTFSVVLRVEQEAGLGLPDNFTGYGTLTVSALGSARLAGVIYNGVGTGLQTFSAGGNIGSDNVLHLFYAPAPVGLRSSQVVGDLTFQSDDNPFTGTLTATNEVIARDDFGGYAATANDISLEVTGSRFSYNPRVRTKRVLPSFDAQASHGKGTIAFTQVDSTPFVDPKVILITPLHTNAVRQDANRVLVAIAPASSSFSGSLAVSGVAGRVPFYGTFSPVDDAGLGFYFYRKLDESGEVNFVFGTVTITADTGAQ